MKKNYRKRREGKLFGLNVRQQLRAFMLTVSIAFMAMGVSAQSTLSIEAFEKMTFFNWHSLGWGNASTVEYSTMWHTEGSHSILLQNTGTGDVWTAYECDAQDIISPSQIKLDIRNGCNIAYIFAVEVVNSSGTSTQIGQFNVPAGTSGTESNLTFTNIAGSFCKIRILQKGYGADQIAVTYVDNIRIGATPVLWANCEPESVPEDHLSWTGLKDAMYVPGKTDNSGSYSTTMYSPDPEFSSTASIIMQWDATVNLSETAAELGALNLSPVIDLSAYNVYELDVYRPLGTDDNVEVKIWAWSESLSSGKMTAGVKIPDDDTWTTIQIPIETSDCMASVSELKIVVQQTNNYTTGTLYFDNLRASQSGVYPEDPIITPLPDYVHVLKNYENSDTTLLSNKFYGQTGVGQSSVEVSPGVFENTAEISQALSTESMSGQYGVALTYDVTNEAGFVYFNHKLSLNSEKDKFVLYMKAASATENPETVTLQFKDKDNMGDAYWSGASILLHGVTDQWQQWIIDINNDDFVIFRDGFDRDNITEVVIVVDHLNSTAKTGTLYIDDLTFVDATDDLTAYKGHAIPESSIVSPLPDYDHVLKDYEGSDTTLLSNRFYGQTGVGQSSYHDPVLGWVNTATINQALSGGYQAGNGVALDYDVSQSESFVYFNHKLSLNSEKNKFAFYMKAASEAENPGTVVLQFKDKDNAGAAHWSGMNCMLHGITTDWQQWIVDIDTLTRFLCSEAGYIGMDISNVTEMVLVVDHVNSSAKTGTLFVDGLTFIDQTDELDPYKGHAIPENSIISPLPDYAHVLKDYEGSDTTLLFNKFYGQSGVGQSSYYDSVQQGWVNTATLTQALSGGYLTGNGVALDYDVSQSGSFVYFNHKLSLNSEKNKFAVYMKAASEAENPGTVVLQFKDKDNAGAVHWSGMNCMLHGITTEWQQWIVDIDTLTRFICSEAGYIGMDISNVAEMVLVVDHVNSTLKTGTLFVDGLTFIDQTDELVPYPGFLPDPKPGEVLVGSNLDDPLLWKTFHASGSTINLLSFPGINSDGIIYNYNLNGGWVTMRTKATYTPSVNPLAFFVKPAGEGQLEVKLIDTDGTIFGKNISMSKYSEWMRVVVYLDDMSFTGNLYGNGDDVFDVLDSVEFGFSGGNKSLLWFDEIGFAPEGTPSSFGPVLNPDRELPGIGFAQRRAESMIAEDPLVLEYLKKMQDIDGSLVPDIEGGNTAQTFNNVIVATAFIIKGEQSRAESILDFYQSHAVNTGNSNLEAQEFYYNGEARGFYQYMDMTSLEGAREGHRWMGDMAWMLFAYKHYKQQYNSSKYDDIIDKLKNLIISFYIDAPVGGYIGSGWRNFDTELHETNGHHEGNIDAYAVMKMCGEDAMAQNIKDWLEHEINNVLNSNTLPLDLYSWRVLAYEGQAELLDIPEYDLRYLKTLNVNGTDVKGLFSYPDIWVDNIWGDGVGHMACAYLLYGDKQRGYFYANQMDAMIIEEEIGGTITHSIPYTLNTTGGFNWVDPEKGFVSCVAWYIFAKNEFNPFVLTDAVYNINLDVPYVVNEDPLYSGATCAKMILDYEAGNSITQSDIQQYGTDNNYSANTGADFIDPYGMYRSLNHFELDYRYNYAQLTRNTRDDAYRDLCYWISYTIPNTPRAHLPSVVPINGSFSDWFVVNGFQSSANPHVQSDYTVYGFYVTDPRSDGVGHNMFIQGNTFSTYYYYPISSSDIWNGKYVSVNEPPAGGGTVSVELERELIEPGDNDLRFAIVEYAFADYSLDNNSAILDVLAAGVQRDRIYFVDLEGTLYDYYIVTYSRSGNDDCIVVAVIDANNGALKLLTYNEPDYNYYTWLDNYTNYTRLKSSEQNDHQNSLLYPIKGSVSLTNESDVNFTNDQESGFEIMPNPASDFAHIKYNIAQESMVNISMYDLSGKLVKTIANQKQAEGYYNLEVNLQDINNGIYLIRCNTNEKVEVKKLIINK